MKREALRVEIINEGPVQSRDPLPVIRFGSDNEHCLHKLMITYISQSKRLIGSLYRGTQTCFELMR